MRRTPWELSRRPIFSCLSHICVRYWNRKGSEFLRKARRLANRKGLAYRWAPAHGKGSHGTLYLGSRSTVVKDLKKDFGAGLLHAMCRDLGIDPQEL